jgi:hypothetical protein
MSSIHHVRSNSIAGLKISDFFVIASDAEIADLYFFLEVFDESFEVGAVFSLGDEEAVLGDHVIFVFEEGGMLLAAEETLAGIFCEGGGDLDFFLFGFDDDLRVVSLRLGMLIESIGRPEGFPSYNQRYLH